MALLLSKCHKMLELYSNLAIILYKRNPNVIVYKTNRGYVLLSKQCTRSSSKCKVHIKKHGGTASNDSTMLQKHLEYKILTLFGEVKSGKVSFHILKEVVNMFETTDCQLYHSLSVLLLKCCGSVLPDVSPMERQEIADRIWKILQRRKIQLTEEHYNILLMILEENSQVLDPKTFLESMTVKPTKNTYYHLLNVVARMGNYTSVTEVLNIMKKKRFPIDCKQCNALVYVHAINGNMTKAEKIINSMKSANIMPTSETYLQLAIGYAKLNDTSNLLKILQHKQCSISSIMELVRNLILLDRTVYIPDVLRCIKEPLKGSESVIANAIIQCVYEKRIEEAYMILENIPASAEELENFADLFLKEIIKFNFPAETVLKYMEAITAAEYIPNALLKTVEYSLRSGNQTVALKLFELMKSRNILIRTHYYWPLLVSARKSAGITAMYPIMKHMLAMNVKVDIETLYEYVFRYMSTTDPIIALNKVKETGVPTSDALTSLLMILLDNNDTNGAMKLCSYIHATIKHEYILKKLIKAYYATKDIDVCVYTLLNHSNSGHKYTTKFLVQLLHNGVEDKDAEAINKFLAAMKAHKVKVPKADIILIQQIVNDTTLNEDKKNIILRTLQEIPTETSSEDSLVTTRKHPRYMDIKKLYAHIVELKAKNMNTRGALRKLFALACKENDLQQVEEIMREYNLNNYKWTPGMKLFLFQFYTKMNMKDEAKEVWSGIKRDFSNIQIDGFKIVDYATLLVRHGEISEAFSIIEENVPASENTNLTRNCWNLLNSIAHSSDFHRTHEMFQILVKNKYCKVDNQLLGPIVRVSLEREDITSTINVFKKCVIDYQKTPLKQEIMTRIVKEADNSDVLHSSTVKKMLSLVKSVHNKRVAIATLIIALSECEKTDTLQNVLSKNMDIPTDLLIVHLKSLPLSKRLSPALILLKACESVQKRSLEGLYEFVLSIYSELGDCAGATVLWMGMKAKNVKPTQKFQEHFVQLLISHKFPVPPNITINT